VLGEPFFPVRVQPKGMPGLLLCRIVTSAPSRVLVIGVE
jgi:hypothetical protein